MIKAFNTSVSTLIRPNRLENPEAKAGGVPLPPGLQAAASRNSVSLPERVKQEESDDESQPTPPFLPNRDNAPRKPSFLPTPAPFTATTSQPSFPSPSSFPPAPVRALTFYSSPRPLLDSSTETPKTLSRFLFSPSSSPPPTHSPPSQVLPDDTFTPSRAGPVFPIRRLGERD